MSYMLSNTLFSSFSQCPLTTFCNLLIVYDPSYSGCCFVDLLCQKKLISQVISFVPFYDNFIYTLNMLFSRSAKLKLIRDHKEKVDLAQMPLTYLSILSHCVFSLILPYKYPEKPGVIQFSGLQILKLT